MTSSPTPSATAVPAGECTSDQLDVAIETSPRGAGGSAGATALFTDHSGSACVLTGAVEVQLMGPDGAPLPATQTPATSGRAWLVPDRMALDPWAPQPGDATVQVTWQSGAGACAHPASEMTLTVGGASVSAPLESPAASPPPTVLCDGVAAVGQIQAAAAPAFPGSARQAADWELQIEEGLAPSPSCGGAAGDCLTLSAATLGTDTAYFEYLLEGSRNATCYAYVYRDGSGWHPFDVICSPGTAPAVGSAVTVSFPGGGCVGIRAVPGHLSPSVGCVRSGSRSYVVDGAPVYVAEKDAATGLSMGTIWWYLGGLNGWIAQDWLA